MAKKPAAAAKKVEKKEVVAPAAEPILDAADEVAAPVEPEAPAVEPAAEVKGRYHVKISTNDQIFETDTDDIKGYISSLGFNHLKTKTIITVSNGEKTVEKILMSAFARRLFINPLTALVFEKNTKAALGE